MNAKARPIKEARLSAPPGRPVTWAGLHGSSLALALREAVGLEICQRASLKGLLVPEVARLGSGFIVTANLVEPTTEATVAEMCEKLLANTVIETYRVEVL